jgi:hypothetical protein
MTGTGFRGYGMHSHIRRDGPGTRPKANAHSEVMSIAMSLIETAQLHGPDMILKDGKLRAQLEYKNGGSHVINIVAAFSSKVPKLREKLAESEELHEKFPELAHVLVSFGNPEVLLKLAENLAAIGKKSGSKTVYDILITSTHVKVVEAAKETKKRSLPPFRTEHK